jgi:hypothetical protein
MVMRNPPTHGNPVAQQRAAPKDLDPSQQASAKTALKSLGFDEAEARLAPDAGAQPKASAPKAAPTSAAQGKATKIVDVYGKTDPLRIAEGLVVHDALKDGEVLEALAALVGQKAVSQAVLSQHLVKTGRSNGEPTKPGALGGKRTADADAKAEKVAGEVLVGLEKATQENQAATNARTGEAKPLTHAVSAHGKGSDQVNRLVHGRRADELAHDASKPAATKTLTGNRNGEADVAVPAYSTVGRDASNTSGAFSSHRGMLHLVGEAFAQASMVDQFASGARADAKKAGKESHVDADERRLVTNVRGEKGQEVGFNLEVEGHSAQQQGATLSRDEMETRFKSIKRTGGLENATVVLDPAYNAEGKRVGWNLQTAYANSNSASDSYAKPSDVGGKEHDVSARAEKTRAMAKAKKQESEEAAKELKGLEGQLAGRKKGLEAKKNPLKKAESALEAAKAQGVTGAELEKFQKTVESAKKDIADLEAQIAQLTVQVPAAKAKADAAKTAVEAAKKVEADTAKEARDLAATKPSGGGGGSKAASAGYDPVSGKWVTGRPEKPDSIPSIKATDENGTPLTAHHLYPWNKIEADLNAALVAKDQAALSKLFVFGEVTVDAWFWTELQKQPAARSYAFAEVLNHAVPKICWSPSNVFMGPSGRGDDPGEKVDNAYTKSGLVSPASALAELMHKSGGIGGDASKGKGKLADMLMRNMREGGGGVAKPYAKEEWTKDAKGKPIRNIPKR